MDYKDPTSAPFQTPEPTHQPVSTPFPQPVLNNTTATPQGKSKFALWSLILGIVSAALAVVFFISIPAAIVAIVLGIVALVKQHPGKGKSIAGIITASFALLVLIPISAIITLGVIAGVSEGLDSKEGRDLLQQLQNDVKSDDSKDTSTTEPSATKTKVTTDCYTYAIPANYVFDDNSKDCHTAINIPGGDALTRIQAKGTVGEIGTLDEVVAHYNNTLETTYPNSKGIIDKEQFIVNGKTVYYVSYEDGSGLLTGIYIVNDPESTKMLGGEPVEAYSILGYTYNSTLKATVRSVVDSFVTK